jgi:hypothetical protein
MFQACVARLIIDPAYRDRVRAFGVAASEVSLTERERSRLCRIAVDRGVDVNRTLHKGFRLGKLRAMLPLTCRLLGSARLAREVTVFWARRLPSSFYFIPEALEFCSYLATRKLRVKYLAEVIAYERTTLEMERAGWSVPASRRIRFRHDPRILLAMLAGNRRPRAVPERPSIAVCLRDRAGQIRWKLVEPNVCGAVLTDGVKPDRA